MFVRAFKCGDKVAIGHYRWSFILLRFVASKQRFIPFTNIVTDEPVLMIDSQTSLRDLHACVSGRLHTILNYLTSMSRLFLETWPSSSVWRVNG